jgi:hypothetical protein
MSYLARGPSPLGIDSQASAALGRRAVLGLTSALSEAAA